MRFATMIGPVVLLAAAGCEKTDPLYCSQNPGASGCPRPDGDVPRDERLIDMGETTGDARLCYGGGAYTVCLAAPPIDALIYTSPTTFDTANTNPDCKAATWSVASDQPDVCFLVGTLVDIRSSFTVIGPRPLVILSASTIDIKATLDVAGHRLDLGNKAGPGAGIGCTAGTAPGSDADGGGGGAGGSFVGNGGDGGDGAGTNNNGVAAVVGGQLPTRLRGGCSGTVGGLGQGGATPPAGPGGGGLFLVAGTQITLSDGVAINASGGGGGAPGREGGGGGGGSGGMIVLNASMILGQGAGAFMVANGGGGGGGEDDAGGTAAVPGNEPDPAMPLVVAAGGDGSAGDGGGGATESDAAQPGANAGANRGGGGGGGAKGYIQANVMPTNVTASPAITVIANP